MVLRVIIKIKISMAGQSKPKAVSVKNEAGNLLDAIMRICP